MSGDPARTIKQDPSLPGLLLPKAVGGQPTVIAASSKANPMGQITTWEDNSPDTLLDICTRFVLAHPQTFCYRVDSSNLTEDCNAPKVVLLPNVCLPTRICDRVLEMLSEEGFDITDEVAGIFANVEMSRLRTAKLQGSSITDQGLGHIIKHNLRELDIHNCKNLTGSGLEILNKHSGNLVSINIGNCVNFLPLEISSQTDQQADPLLYEKRGYILWAPNLMRFTAQNLFVLQGSTAYLDLLLKPLTRLTHLDLSGFFHDSVCQFSFLEHLSMLVSLVLHDVLDLSLAVQNIVKTKSLRHLDMSTSYTYDDDDMIFSEPNEVLSTLVNNLPNLCSLDISGTNLAGSGLETNSVCDIPGLSSRVDKPLDYLGLYRTHNNASTRTNIPAIKIAGNSTKDQILAAGLYLMDRPRLLKHVLNDLRNMLNVMESEDIKRALDIVLIAIERYPDIKDIQILGSLCLDLVLKSDNISLNTKMRRKIVRILLSLMSLQIEENLRLISNGLVTLARLNIPEDVLFCYDRLMDILSFAISVQMDSEDDDEDFAEPALWVLNLMAFPEDAVPWKIEMGKRGFVRIMIDLIKRQMQDTGSDSQALEMAWSYLCNMTDEIPENCHLFLANEGIDLSLQLIKADVYESSLIETILGVLGNVSEVPVLRSSLMTKNVIEGVASKVGVICETSYRATYILAKLASDGETAWHIQDPPRNDILKQMAEAMGKWAHDTELDVLYRNFEPFLQLLQVDHTPECQLWAAWALVNITCTDLTYCRLLERQGGYMILEDLVSKSAQKADSPFLPRILELMQIVFANYKIWKAEGAPESK